LPPDGKYYLPNSGWMENLPNKLIIGGWTVEEGQDYVAKSGRIHGWSVAYQRGTSNVLMPQEVYDNVVLYSSIEGATYTLGLSKERDLENGWVEIPKMFEIGDDAYFVKYQDGNLIHYFVGFRYKNIGHFVNVYGRENEISENFLRGVCIKLIEKIQTYPLSSEVTFKP
ncbi:MAG: hypothetical protein Q8L68_07720, partial [Methylococcales bacterium]|nr:hypothetical protein [Methylococcales bacterium]